MSMAADALSDASLASLREDRMRARRALELVLLRHRGTGGSEPAEAAALRVTIDAMTEELIRRYSADLTLVDSLLDPAYPPDRGGAR